MIDQDDHNHAQLLAQLTREFLEDASERMTLLTALFEEAIHDKNVATENLHAFRRELHTLKGQGGSFGFPSVSIIAHRFEDFLLDFEDGDDWGLGSVQKYLDILDRIIQEGQEPSPKEVKEYLKSLPASITAPDSRITVLWVCSARVIRHKVRRDLESFGFSVISMNDPFDAMRYLCKATPEFLISSATLDGISGFELIRVVSELEQTRHIPSILVTSLKPGHAQIEQMPKHVPVVRLTPNIGNDLALALSSLEYKAVRPDFNVRKD